MARISLRYLAYRLVVSYFVILGIMTLAFLLLRLMPGTFADALVSPEMPREAREAIIEQYGLNEPLWRQYLAFMVNYQTGQFGWSPTYGTEVWSLIERRLPRTLILFGASFIFGYIIGPLVGMYLGWWRGTKRDKSVFAAGLVAYSMPAFWIAWLLIWLFNYELGWLPSAYMMSQYPDDPSLLAPFEQWTWWRAIIDVLHHIALPLFSIISVGWVGAMLVMRTQMNTVVDSDYVYLAKAKGLSERTVMIKHAARNALIPVATQAIVGVAFIIDGAVIIEYVFSWPGMGALIVDTVLRRDYPTAQAVFFILGVLIVVMRLLTDIAYTYLDPRISFEGGE